jgi:hypothetical protein
MSGWSSDQDRTRRKHTVPLTGERRSLADDSLPPVDQAVRKSSALRYVDGSGSLRGSHRREVLALSFRPTSARPSTYCLRCRAAHAHSVPRPVVCSLQHYRNLFDRFELWINVELPFWPSSRVCLFDTEEAGGPTHKRQPGGQPPAGPAIPTYARPREGPGVSGSRPQPAESDPSLDRCRGSRPGSSGPDNASTDSGGVSATLPATSCADHPNQPGAQQ